LTESVGKEDPATQPLPLKLLVGAGGRQSERHVHKAQGLKRRSRGSRPCNRKGARGGWQTDFPRIIVKRYRWWALTFVYGIKLENNHKIF